MNLTGEPGEESTMTTTITQDTSLATLINVFTVEPARQQELLDLLYKATEDVMRHQPGFVSANLHRSTDGTKVVNYAQWQSEEHFHRMLDDPVAQEHMRQASELASSVEPRLYTVDSVHA
jgi:quinol monooxygenase YgiN